jgi:hypothetical protein
LVLAGASSIVLRAGRGVGSRRSFRELKKTQESDGAMLGLLVSDW